MVVSYAGGFHDHGGAAEFLSILDESYSRPVGLVIQSGGVHEKALEKAVNKLKENHPVFFFPRRSTYTDAIRITSMADIGFVAYNQTAPQFQEMGHSSNKLCAHLMLGQPVIVKKQTSFEKFTRSHAALSYKSESEIPAIIEKILARPDYYSEQARRHWELEIDMMRRVENLRELFSMQP